MELYRILIIGNGFDIAHELLTGYFDFLYACCLVNGRKFNGKERINGKNQNYDPKKFTIEASIKRAFEPIKDKIINNKWINYFLDKVDRLEPLWIDLEREIFDVCSMIIDLKKGKRKISFKGKPYNKNDFASLNLDQDNYDIKQLKEDLQNLIDILDIYLGVATSTNKKVFYKEILDYFPDYVINFNYTDTYYKIYSSLPKTDYVHGKLSDQSKKNSIVLGFNSTKEMNDDVEYAEFLKYYQMVKNKVNINVFNVLGKGWYRFQSGGTSTIDKRYELMVFGHSLDKTDSDILLPLIVNADKVKIYYHSEQAMSENIKHLMEMIGDREKFIEYCFKSNNKITFIQQTDKVKSEEKYNQLQTLRHFLSMGVQDKGDYDELRSYCAKNAFEKYPIIYAKLVDKLLQYMEQLSKDEDSIIDKNIDDFSLIYERIGQEDILIYLSDTTRYWKMRNAKKLSKRK